MADNATPWSEEWVVDKVKTMYTEWNECTRCGLCRTRKEVVFGAGAANADIVFIGQAPGEVEDREGYPFHPDAPAGIMFETLLEAARIPRDDVFVTNVVGCHPPENRDPTTEERNACLKRVYDLLYYIDPVIIVPMGKPAMQTLMGGEWRGIMDKAGELGFVDIPGQYHSKVTYPAIPILHPAFIMRKDSIDPSTKRWTEGGPAQSTLNQLRMVKEMVGFLKDKYSHEGKRLSGHPALKVIQ